MINLLNSILFNAKRHENIGGGNSRVLHVEASDFTRIPSVARRSTDGESQRAYSVSMRSIRFAALLFLFFMVGAGNVWGIDWSGYSYLGDGAGGGAYSNKYKVANAVGQGVVNIQRPGFATADGIYTTFPASPISYCSLGPSCNYNIDGAGMLLHLDAFTAKETEVKVTANGVDYVFTVYYEDGVTGGGDKVLSFIYSRYGYDNGSETKYYCNGSTADKDKYIYDSDFNWNQTKDNVVTTTISGQTWTGIDQSQACTREDVSFSAGKYILTLLTYRTNHNANMTLPSISINGGSAITAKEARWNCGGSTETIVSNQFNYTNDNSKGAFQTEVELVYETTIASAGSYGVSISFPSGYDRAKDLIKTLTITKDMSCTAPNHVDVTGNYRFTPGETISLTATAYSSAGTGSPITEGVTYQWQKYTGSWTDVTDGGNISGATTANLVISSCSTSNGGSYRCIASTGSGCDTYSDADVSAHFIRVWTFNGNYSGSSFEAHSITWTGSNTGTVTLNLNANSTYEFKIYDNDGKTFGCNSGISTDASNWTFYSDNSNCSLTTGAYGGAYTFTLDVTNVGSNNITVSVTYPRKTIYVVPNDYTTASAKLSIYYWRGGTNGWSNFLISDDCSDGKYYAEIPGWAQYFSIVRLNSDATVGTWDKKWNQTGDITANASYNQYTVNTWCSGDGCKEGTTPGSYSPTTYTISFAGNGNTSGSMSSVGSIPCGEDRTLVANGYIKTGYNFANWKTNVAITANSSAVAANGAVADEATINNITSNITLTAQWTAKTSAITFDKEEGSGGSNGATGTYGSAMPSITAPTRTGYDFGGYWDGDNGTGTQYYKADGTSERNWDKDKEDGTTLYAKWTPSVYTVTLNVNSGTINAGNVTNYTYGVGATLPTNVTRDGYRFMGWYAASNFSGGQVTTIANDATGNKEYWAKWAQSYTITNGNPSNGTITVNSTAIEGETVSIVATPSSGYAFEEWTITKTSDGSDVTASVSLSGSTDSENFTMPAYGVTVTATFVETTCTNTYTIDCGSTADYVVPTSGTRVPSTQSNEAGIYTDYYTGYHGEGYYDFKGATYSEIYYAVHLPAAQYTFEVYTATDKDGQYINVYRRTDGESGDISYGGYYYTKMISQPNSYNNNKAFGVGRTISEQNLAEEDYIIGLYSNGDYAAYDQVVITANSDVFCRASTYDVTITGSPAAGQASATGAGSYEEGETVTINATANRGYSFNTWSADPSVSFSSAATTASNSFSMPASDVALTASYNTLTSRTVTVNNDGNGSGSADLNPAYVGETVTLSATPNTGYRFVEWTTSDGVSFASSTSASTTFTMLDKNVTVQANFALVDNVIISGTSNVITDKGWSGNGGSMTITSNVADVTCSFGHNILKIDYSGLSTNDAYCSKCIEDNSDYNSSLSDGATGFGFYYRTSSSTDAVAFVLEYNTSSHDQYKKLLAATNGVWKYVYLPIAAADEWNGGEVVIFMNRKTQATEGGADIYTTDASGTFYIADLTATAITSKSDISNIYTATVQANNGSYGSVTGSGSYYGCETVSITATPNACYRFVNWTTNDGVTFGDENSASTTFDMTGSNVTVTANFEQKNLAEKKTVCAGWPRKTVEINASEVPEKAVDGDLNSHHIQWAIDDNFATKGWWAVDLGDNYVLSDIKIYWQADQDGRAPRSYEIQAAITTPTDFVDDAVMSDDRWHTIKTVSGVTQYTGSTANILSFTVGEHAVARYLRIVNKDADRKPMAISEFEVYGTGTENCYAANTPTASFVGIVDGQIKLNLSATNTNGDALSNFAVLYGGVYYDVTASEGVGALTLPTHRDITVRVYAYNTCMERSTGYVDVAVGDYVNPVDNLAELKTTWVSYTNNNADEKQANLNDGILDNNGWIPYQNTGANAWMVVDLGDTYQISSVETFFATGRKSTNYKIYGRQEDPVTDDVRGDNTQWVELASKSSSINSGATESDVNESAVTYTGAIRYVRFESFAEEWADAENGFKLLEFRVFGSVFKSRDVTGPTWTDANCAVTSAVGNTITMTLEATDTHPEHVYNFTINVSDGSSNRNYERSTTAMSNEITITDAELIASCQSYTVTATCYDDAGNASTPKEFSNVVPSIVAETNLAIGKTATAGTTQGGYVAGNAIDDNNTTMWSGNYERNDGVNQWIYVNLGERYDLSKIHIRWGDNSNTWPQDYELQVSNDGSVFAPVAHYTSVSANQANDYVVSDVTAQYVRVWANKAGSTYGMEMQELKVYGNCETDTELPIMLFAEALDDDVYVTAADIYVGAIHKSIASNQLLYHVDYTDNTNGSYSGSRTFTAAEVTNGRFQLDNLQSGHSYTVTIYAAKTSDIAENRSENYKTVSFTTKAIGAYSKYYMANSINGWLAVNGGEWTDAMNAWRFQNTAVNGLYRLQHTVSTTEQWTFILYDRPNALRTTPIDHVINVTSGRDVVMTMRGLNDFVSNYHTLYIAGDAVENATTAQTKALIWEDETTATWVGSVTSGEDFVLNFTDPRAGDATYICNDLLTFTYSESWPYAKLTFDLDTWTCSWEEADPTECSNPGGAESGETIAGANAFTTGYDISIKWKAAVSSSNPDSLIVSATNNDTYETSTGNIYLFFFKTKTSSEIYKEVQLATTASTVTKAIPIPSEVGADEYAYLSVKFERDSKLYITERMLYNLKGGGCSDDEYFDIYHWDDAPEGARTSYDGGNIVLPIRYFRHFANEDWNTITLPFEVSKVTVYDNGDKQEYDLYPRFNNGSADVEGYYWLKTFSDEVSLGGFKSAWQQLTVTTPGASDAERAANVKPEKNTPYVIAFPEYAGYYRTNWVIFHGVAGQTIASDFTGDERIEELGENEEITRVKLQGNNTMHESDALSNIYMIEEGYNYFTRRESIAVPAFEAYVIGTAKVQTRFSILRYTGEEENIPDVTDQPTGIENTPPTTAGYDGEVYTVAGIRVAGFANRDEMETLLNNLGAGVYIVRMGTQINKVVVR